jgi:hypothetical protein
MIRPTQRPLDREEQKRAFEALHQQYAKPSTITYNFPIEAYKPEKPIEEQQLQEFRKMLQDRGMKTDTVDGKLEEKKTSTVIKQFYCNHVFSAVKASYMGLPIRYKICSKCGVVK